MALTAVAVTLAAALIAPPAGAWVLPGPSHTAPEAPDRPNPAPPDEPPPTEPVDETTSTTTPVDPPTPTPANTEPERTVGDAGETTTVSAPDISAQAAADRAQAAARLVSGYDALAAAAEQRRALAAELDAAARDLAAATEEHTRALDEQARTGDLAAAETARADQAARDATAARDRLEAVAVQMYLDPPGELTTAAVSGDVSDHLAVRSLTAARAELAVDATADARATAELARSQADRARAAALASATAQDAAAATLADVTARHQALATAHAAADARASDLASFLGVSDTDEDLAARRRAAELAASGQLVPIALPDGTWTYTTEGLPPDGDIVGVPGSSIRVHATLAGPVARLLVDARAQGVELDGSGWRSPQRQIELRRQHCGSSYEAVFLAPSSACSPPTARPGRSLHERGLAVDFRNCSTRSTVCYRWLSANAHRYGLFNLPSEPWHWSATGQ